MGIGTKTCALFAILSFGGIGLLRPWTNLALSVTLLALMQGFLKESFMPLLVDVIRIPAWIPIVQLPYIYTFIDILQSLISVLLFVAMYLIGKSIPLDQHLRSVVLIVLLAAWGGLFFGRTLGMCPEVMLRTWQNYPYFMLWQFLGMLPRAILLLFLSSTALAIAHIRGLRENLSLGAGAKPVVER
jgi:hypothetical protein